MAKALTSGVWLGRMVYLAAALVLVFLQLLPLDVRPETWASPDWLLALTFAWVARRPEHVPVFLIALVFLLADFLFQRPPGLWSALIVIASEMLRARVSGIRSMPFAVEWGTVALAITACTLGDRLVQTMVMALQAPLGVTLIQMIMTIVFYPLVVGLAQILFGLTRPAVGQVDNRGGKL